MTVYTKTPAPHISAADSVSKMMWKTIAALLPLTVFAVYSSGVKAIFILFAAIGSSVLAEAVGCKWFGKRPALHDGSAALTGLLLALSLPPSTPAWAVAIAGFFSVLIGREIFGGLGTNLFHPAMIGRVLLQVSFSFPMNSFLCPDQLAASLAVFFGGLILISQKLIYWEMPFLHFAALLCLIPLGGGDPRAGIFSANILFVAFFIITDAATTPVERPGKRFFAVGTALIALALRDWAHYQAAIGFSVLAMNAASPWLDRKLKK